MQRLFKRLSVRSEQGFAMPTVIVLMVLMSIVAYAALMQANNNLNLAYKQAYIGMARLASKAAVDYAQEQFDNSICGNYSGTTEQDLTSNNRYRTTFKAEVTDTSSDGYSKTIKGTGSVYLPKLSTSAQYVFDIRSEIVRTYAVCKTPDNFDPLLWLDASQTDTLKKVGTSTTTVSPTTSFGSAGNSTRDTLEERANDGSQTTASWQSNDFEMHICDGTEFTNSICNSNSTKYLNIGMIYSNVNVPKDATITSASLKLACTTPAGAGGSVTHRIYGIYKSASNPHPDLFSQSTSNQIRNKLTTSSLHTVSSATVSTNNCPPGNNTTFDVTSIVQEIVDDPDWDPTNAANGGRLGFAIQRVSGSGSRHLLKDGNQLNVSYSTSTVSQANNGEGVGEWDDISGNGNNAIFAFGNTPTRVDNQINSKTIVRFNNGAFLSSLTAALADKREMTVFAVLKANYGTSASNGRVVSGMTDTATSDTSGSTAIIPLLRNASGSGFSNLYTGSSSTYRTDTTCSPTCPSNPYLYTSVFQVDDSNNTVTSQLKGNGTLANQKTGMNPSGSPYTFGINQLYIGGNRSGAMPGSGVNYFNGDYAEIVVYDKALECRQIEALEEYFRAKWNIWGTTNATACPDDSVPTL